MKTHWASKYIGIPYVPGGRTPKGVDCWGLIRLAYLWDFGIVLPVYPGIAQRGLGVIMEQIREDSRKDWTEIPEPEEACAVGMAQKTVIHHVGLYTRADGGKIIHALEGNHGTVAEPVKFLTHLRGFTLIKFYRHRLWPTLLS